MNSDLTHPSIKDGWFTEISNTLWPGQAMALKVEKVLHVEQSKYQNILVFKSTDHGNVLVLDNYIQVTENDEFAYLEMIAHLGLNSHPNPKRALVIGGGDGGVLREILKHSSIEEAWLCDIDESVIEVSKKYLPRLSKSYEDSRVRVHIGDGFEFLAKYKNTFDVIITDSSDPEGPGESLFQKPYYDLLNRALTEKGVITTQAENIWLHMLLISKLKKDCKAIFPIVEYAYTMIPTYPSGSIGFMVCCKDPTINIKKPIRADQFVSDNLKYYTKEIHEASFVLPKFADEILNNL